MHYKADQERRRDHRQNAFHQRRPVLFALLISISVIALGIAGIFLANAVVGTTDGPKGLFVSQLPGVLIFVWLVTRTAGTLGFFHPQRWRSVGLLAIPSLLVALTALDMVAHPDFSQFGWKVAGNLMIGAFEEAGLRGLVLVALVRAWGSTSAGLVRAIVASSSVFGILHLLNLRSEPVIPTLLQVVFATFIGICFAGVLLRTRALVGLIVIHGLVDLMSDLQAKSDTPPTVSSGLVACAATLPFAIAGLWVVRRRTIDTTILQPEN
jgi:Type II CAAX prenyl endopeptidase Rce1-like